MSREREDIGGMAESDSSEGETDEEELDMEVEEEKVSEGLRCSRGNDHDDVDFTVSKLPLKGFSRADDDQEEDFFGSGSEEGLEAELQEASEALEASEARLQSHGTAWKSSELQKDKVDEKKMSREDDARDAGEMTSYHENGKKQLKALEENSQVQREAERRITSVEERFVKDRLHHKCELEMEERSRMFGFEMDLLSTYFEASYQEFVQQEAGRHADTNTNKVSKETDLKEAHDKLREKKAENVVGLKTDIVASSKIVDNLQAEVTSQAGMLARNKRDFEDDLASDLVREEAKVNERQKETGNSEQHLEEAVSDPRTEDEEAPEGFDENEWKSNIEDDIIFALVENNHQQYAQEIAHLQEQLKQKHMEILSLRNEVAEQNSRLDSYTSDLSNFQKVIAEDDQEPSDCRHTAEITHGAPVLIEQQSVARGALDVVQNLRNMKVALVAGIEIERKKVQQLEEALADQRWTYQVEFDVSTTVFREGLDRGAAAQAAANQVLSNYEQIHQELGVHKGNNKEKIPDLSVPLLVRQNSELRREKEQLLEQKTDEIYKLKGEFYKQLEDLKRGQSPGFLRRTASAQDGEGKVRAPWMKEKVPDADRASEFEVELRSAKRRLLEALSQRDEQIQGTACQLREFSANLEGKEKQILALEGAISRSSDEASVLRTELNTLQQYLGSQFEERMHGLVALIQQVENDFSQRMKEYNLRLDEAKSLLKLVPKQSSRIASSGGGYQQNIKDLQKAEAEVDLLGDEVDTLLQVLETVYSVMNHYAPVIQHYPGMAELLKIVRQQVLQSVYVSSEA